MQWASKVTKERELGKMMMDLSYKGYLIKSCTRFISMTYHLHMYIFRLGEEYTIVIMTF